MSDVVIKVDSVSKQYRLGEVSTGTIAHDVNRWWYKIRGKEDPYLSIAEANDRTVKSKSDYVWALRDVNLSVRRGEVLGIIGKNGAGKSTLLKILSRTTVPTLGSIKIKGRLASLLEVGTGFHPELSGRDNIFLNGAILGMHKQEIKRKLDEIIDFSGVERYIDTPVKRYSSGMYVRLAFAVAAHLESEILVVDEVLAVGDAEFQKKCLGKMGQVSKTEGRAILFVSHNMAAIRQLCTTGILMENGTKRTEGKIESVIGAYYKKSDGLEGRFTPGRLDSTEKVVAEKVIVMNQHKQITEDFKIGDSLTVELVFHSDEDISAPHILVSIKSKYANVTGASTILDNAKVPDFKRGKNFVRLTFEKLPLLPQEYYLNLGVRTNDGRVSLMHTKEIGYFAITSSMSDIGVMGSLADKMALESISPFIPYEWEFENGNKQSFNILNNVKR